MKNNFYIILISMQSALTLVGIKNECTIPLSIGATREGLGGLAPKTYQSLPKTNYSIVS